MFISLTFVPLFSFLLRDVCVTAPPQAVTAHSSGRKRSCITYVVASAAPVSESEARSDF